MPKYGIHQIVLTEAIRRLRDSGSSTSAQNAGDLLNNNRKIAMLGAVGPDLFFWAPDYESTRLIYQLYKNIDEIVEIFSHVTQPLRDLVNAVQEQIETEIRNGI